MKKMTKENWCEVDPIGSGVFVRLSLTDETTEPIAPADWAQRFLRPTLSPAVPDDIRKAFEVARGAMIYGVFFYPLFTLGLEQVFRITEMVARAKAAALGVSLVNAKGRHQTYEWLLCDLRKKKVLTDDDHVFWSNVRKFRNATTHAERQMIVTPSHALGMVSSLTESINRLFAP